MQQYQTACSGKNNKGDFLVKDRDKEKEIKQKKEKEELTGMAAVWDYLKTFLIIFCVVFAMNKLVYINAVIPSESMQNTMNC